MKSTFYFFLFVTSFTFSQDNKFNEIIIDKIDKIFSIDNPEYFIDTTRSIPFKDIINKPFIKFKSKPEDIQSKIWRKFYVTPKIETEFIIFTPHMTSKSEVYIPYHKGYKKKVIGIISNKKITYDFTNSSLLYLLKDSIDFKKPFYYNTSILTKFENDNRASSGFLVQSNDPVKWVNKNFSFSLNKEYGIYLSIIFMSFILFLVNYFITKDKNFLNYSFYLLFNVLIFIRIIPYFYNLYVDINPLLISISTSFSVIMASISYFYFVIYFVEAKKNFTKIYPIIKYTVIASILIAIFIVIQLTFIPYFPYRFTMLSVYNIAFLIISVFVFIYLISKPLSVTKRIVVLGSLVLIIGQIFSLLTGNTFYFLNTVMVEIIIFSGVVSYQNRLSNYEKIESESALKMEKSKLENLKKLEELKSVFFSNISHEFRTPLTLISGPIQQQLEKNEISKEERKNLEMMDRNSKRLLTLVDQLLGISKIESGNLNLIVSNNNIIIFVETLINNFNFAAKQKNLLFETNVKSTKIETWFDKDIIEKIITNLLSNAIKYTPYNGKIKIISNVDENTFFFKIKNTGKQLTSEELEKIFERFYQIDASKQGTGVGLSLVKEMLNIHKGKINVSSTKEWTTFNVSIPINKLYYDNTSLKIKNKLQLSNNLESITNKIIEEENDNIEEKPILLIVEDNSDIQIYIESIFKNNYSILQAKNGQEGIDLAIEKIPDIIISDVMMPIKDGITLSNILKTDERTSHIPIILLTAKTGDTNKIIGIESGADDYITKPFNHELLKLKVEKLIEIRKKLQNRYSKNIILKPKDISLNSTDEIFIKRMKTILDENITESSFNIERFCVLIGMSRMQLHRKLKALTNLTTSEFIRSQRLKLASELLKNTNVNVSQICYSVGFNNPAYFSKTFKEEFGITPTQFANKTQ